MRCALLADIHANSCALRAVLSAAKRQHVDTLIIAGDLVGYYFSPREVLGMLEPWSKFMVRGNHENMLYRSMNDTNELAAVTRRYGSGIELAIDQLSEVERKKLTKLPHPLAFELDGRNILLCHGAPSNIDSYIYPDSDLSNLKNYVPRNADLIVLGHTHYPMLSSLSEATRLVNPGSVGQPRNGCPGAHWALYDTGNGEITLHCEEYDYAQLQQEARARHPELPYLAEVLSRQ
jgi:putative phosphoesterase